MSRLSWILTGIGALVVAVAAIVFVASLGDPSPAPPSSTSTSAGTATAPSPTPPVGEGPPDGFKAFAADSIFNRPLGSDVAVDADGGRMVRWLTRSIAANHVWINTDKCGQPLYWAPRDTRRVRVRLDHPSFMDPALVEAFSSVPIPKGAKPADCGDANFSVAQVQPDGEVKAWEFWVAKQSPSGAWSAQWGGAMDDLRTDEGIANPDAWHAEDQSDATPFAARQSNTGWNVSASSISMNAGVITQRDLRAGRIDHALAMALNDTAKGSWRFPAQRSDGTSDDPDALPEGAHLRLDPAVDVAAIPGPPIARMVAEAAQRYGILVRDRTYSSNVLYADADVTADPARLGELLAGQTPDAALAKFPWSRLQLVQAQTCDYQRACPAP